MMMLIMITMRGGVDDRKDVSDDDCGVGDEW